VPHSSPPWGSVTCLLSPSHLRRGHGGSAVTCSFSPMPPARRSRVHTHEALRYCPAVCSRCLLADLAHPDHSAPWAREGSPLTSPDAQQHASSSVNTSRISRNPSWSHLAAPRRIISCHTQPSVPKGNENPMLLFIDRNPRAPDTKFSILNFRNAALECNRLLAS
jgi:hypothetical protein